MNTMKDSGVLECLIEAVVGATTEATQVSVCILGPEVSVNVDGQMFNFVVDGDQASQVCHPLTRR